MNLGVRADLPRLPDTPTRNETVLSTFGIDTSNVPSGDVIVSPRFGFNWSPSASGKEQVRGGVGVFAGRTPFVWISNAYANTGVETTTLTAKNVPFNPDPYNQPKNFPPGTAAYQVDGIDPNFKFPKILRANLAYDHEFPMGIRASVEGMYTKTLQDVFYLNMGKTDTGAKSFDGRPIYKNISTSISDVFYMTNTDEGQPDERDDPARQALRLRPVPERLLRVHGREGGVRRDVEPGRLELAVLREPRRHLHPRAHPFVLGSQGPLQLHRDPELQDRLPPPQPSASSTTSARASRGRS